MSEQGKLDLSTIDAAAMRAGIEEWNRHVENGRAGQALNLDGQIPVEEAAAGRGGTGAVIWVHGDQTGTEVELQLHAVDPDLAQTYGAGVYLEIGGLRPPGGGMAPAPLEQAIERQDGTVCLWLNEAAKNQLLEQLQTHGFIVDLHSAMAAKAIAASSPAVPKKSPHTDKPRRRRPATPAKKKRRR